MKIFYDYQILLEQKYGGISRYYYEIISELKQNTECDLSIGIIGNRNYYFSRWFKCSFENVNEKIMIRINQLFTLFYLSRHYDIIHPTNYSKYILYFNLKKTKLIITVHDMIQELFMEDQKSVIENKKQLILNADHIIVISDNTKRDLLKYYPSIEEDKITVIYHATTMKKIKYESRPSCFPPKYILFVGRREGYKNFVRFTLAMKDILHNSEFLQVLCVGGGSFTQEELQLFGDDRARFLQMNCNDEMLAAAYSYAECFVFPSEYEGFGIPILEAFACDCPVALSNTSSMPEIGGDAASYFDPYSVESMNQAILRILQSKDFRLDLIKKGRIQNGKFSWKITAKKTIECYKKVLQER